MSGNLKVATATSSFLSWFKYWYKNIEVVKNVEDYDLIIFTGGSDISPEIYGQENLYSFTYPERDNIEIKILKQAMNLNKKILGVCRGHQLINACLGGNLVQDIERQLKINHGGGHNLEYIGDSLVRRSFFEKNYVNSIHHQGVIKAGDNLKVTSTYKGVIESTESDNIISVQFHPEIMDNDLFFKNINDWVNGG